MYKLPGDINDPESVDFIAILMMMPAGSLDPLTRRSLAYMTTELNKHRIAVVDRKADLFASVEVS